MVVSENIKIRLAVVGCGGVGRSFLRLVDEREGRDERISLQVNCILGSKGGIYSPEGIRGTNVVEHLRSGGEIFDFPEGGSRNIDYSRVLDEADMVVVLTPTNKETGEPGMTYIREALKRGKHVITGDKGPILLAYRELRDLARKSSVQLGIGCTTGGALPSVNAGLFDMAGADITSIEGVLNGSTNFILKEMEDGGTDYREALKKAQSLGIAEADPSLDVEGWDTATKLLILTNILMDRDIRMEDVEVQGITEISLDEIEAARAEGARYKLVGRAKSDEKGVRISVAPERVGADDLLHGVEGRNKAVRYTSDTLGDLTVVGGASGPLPAAASIYRDIVNILKGCRLT